MKDPFKKKESHIRYKQYRNLLPTLLKKSKQFYFTRFFQENIKNLKNMWREIKKIISSNNSNHTFPTAITVNNETITNPYDISNVFNNYFAKVAIDIQSSIRFSKKKYYDYHPPLNIESFFLTPTDSTEVSNIIFSLNQNKSDGPNSIPIKIVKLLNKDISDQLAILFNQSSSSGIFPSILKTSKIISVYKKGSKLECSNYRPISLLSNIDKILERLMYNRLYNYLEKKEIMFSFQFGFRQKYSTTHALIHLTDKIRHEIVIELTILVESL